jgi:hypothetical protein
MEILDQGFRITASASEDKCKTSSVCKKGKKVLVSGLYTLLRQKSLRFTVYGLGLMWWGLGFKLRA